MGGLARWSFFLQALPSERCLPEPATSQHQMQVTCSTIWVQTESLLLRTRRSVRRPGWPLPGKQPVVFKGAFSSSSWKQLLSIWAEYQQSGGLHPPGDKSQVLHVYWHPLHVPTPFTTTLTHTHTIAVCSNRSASENLQTDAASTLITKLTWNNRTKPSPGFNYNHDRAEKREASVGAPEERPSGIFTEHRGPV